MISPTDAALITAAPDLLAMARALVEPFADIGTDFLMEVAHDSAGSLHIVTGRGITPHVALAIVSARAAIDKAEGH